MNKKLLLALAAVFVSGVFNAAIYVLWISDGHTEFGFLLIMSILGGGTVLGYTTFWGLPWHFLLEHKRIGSLPKYLAIGAIPSLVIPIDYFLGSHYVNIIGHVVFMCYVGMVAATVFWWAVRGYA
ncbi:hypothetical protein [Microbulbifer sp. SSSA005]|uniref:hypothetical protein n=1 Tax=Microbulbifer sp. SSSA005 TaxID=3243378 RepID=UPI004039A095